MWRDILSWEVGDASAIQDYTDKCGADAVIEMAMGLGPGLASSDELVLPAGNLGLPVVTSISGTVAALPQSWNSIPAPGVREFVRDVDAYAPYVAG